MTVSSLTDTPAQVLPVSNRDSARALPGSGSGGPRILIIDDTRAIHDDFRKILVAAREPVLEDVEAALFGSPAQQTLHPHFELDSAYQGADGLAMVQQALKSGQRYAMAFVDIRMPPGWDGVETTARLWAADPDLQICICTAYSDYSWEDMVNRFGQADSLLILKKPFDILEVRQIAHALTRKWLLIQEARCRVENLDRAVSQRTQDLRVTNQKLLDEIAERKRSEDDLRVSEERFRSVWEHSADGMRLTDHAGRIIGVNKAYCELVGLGREKLLGELFSVVYDQDALHGDLAEYTRRFAAHDLLPCRSTRVRLWNSRTLDLEVSDSFIELGQQGKVLLSIFKDVSERRRTELRVSAFSALGQRLSTAQTAREAAQIIVDIADQLLSWDACTFALYSPVEDLVRHVMNMDLVNGERTEVRPGYDETAPSPLARRTITQGGQLILRENPEQVPESAIRFGDATRPSASLVYVPIRNGRSVNGILSVQSYTPHAYDQRSLETLQALADHCGAALDRIRTEEALRSSQAQLQLQFDRMPIACITWTPDFRATSWNPAAEKTFGYTAAEALGKHPYDLIVPKEAQPQVDNVWRRIVEGDTASPSINQNQTKNGRTITCDWTNTPLRGADGKIIGVLSMAHDVTERLRAEEALRVSEEHFRSVWERSIDGMRLTDGDGRILAVNEAYCKLVGLPREKLLGEAFSVTYKRHGPNDGMDVYQDRFESGTIIPRLTARVQFWNSVELDLEISCSFIECGRQDKMVLAIFRDVTERKQLEQQLRQSQKMDAIGQLAGGVAHDFNNLLAVIRGNAELILMNEDRVEGMVGDCLKQVVAAADRAANLTRQLLAFSRKQVMQSQPLDLNDVVGNLTKMLKRIIGEHIELQCSYAAKLPLVQADVGMLEQVLVNLVVNARDAMPKGGRLLINTESVTVDAAYAQAHPETRPGDFVALTVSDTGTGIAPEHLPRIFEPFFTTKELGKGTGLGLATVYGIVKQHQGWVDVSSQLGAGSTFRILLPVAPASAAAPAPGPVKSRPRGGSETILLVEDDEAVRALTSRLLESFGYRVLEAASGPQALELWRAQAAPVDLLLTDMVMPDRVTGRELADQLLGQQPSLKIIFMSGYSGEVAGKDTSFIRRTRSRFLQKPCDWRELLQTVRQTLDDTH